MDALVASLIETTPAPVAPVTPPGQIPVNPPAPNKGGRPKGSKTRPDAPSMIAKREKLATVQPPSDGTVHTDTEIFGDITIEQEPPNEHQTHNAYEATPGNEPPPETQTEIPHVAPDAESQRPIAEMIWDTIVGLMATFVGSFWLPRKVGNDPQKGEIPYDERDMVVKAFCVWLASIGMMALTPLQNLWMAIAAYSMPRMFATITVLKSWFAKKAKPAAPQAGNDPRFAKSSPTEKPPEPAKKSTGEQPAIGMTFEQMGLNHE